MIRYALACDQAHDFESWFPSSEAFEEQGTRGLIACPVCGSTHVTKRIMAPAVARRDLAVSPVAEPEETMIDQAAPAAAPTSPNAETVALLSERDRALRAMIREIREQVTKNAENVGVNFTQEARKMHYGEVEERAIYGEASLDDARELLEEGVPLQPLPFLGDDRN